jgi:hypothetical protein
MVNLCEEEEEKQKENVYIVSMVDFNVDNRPIESFKSRCELNGYD